LRKTPIFAAQARVEDIFIGVVESRARTGGYARQVNAAGVDNRSEREPVAIAEPAGIQATPQDHASPTNHHAAAGRHAMTPCVRARTSGEVRQVATAS